MIDRPTAIEFFSGMGSFAEACRHLNVDIVAAFDQDVVANSVYKHNFGLAPCHWTLDSIPLAQIPEAEIWWMSPPCTPFSVRGKRDDLSDPRASSLLRLMHLLSDRLPELIILENVRGFEHSNARLMVVNRLANLDYEVVERKLCSTDFGTPMKRPRYFVVARRRHVHSVGRGQDPPLLENSHQLKPECTEIRPVKKIANYLSETFDENLIMPAAEFRKYEAGLNVVNPDDETAVCICFTKGYYKCRLASGSLIQLPDARVRRFSAREMLRLFGFSANYSFPNVISEQRATGLLGNAVDVRMIRHLLKTKVTPSSREPLFN